MNFLGFPEIVTDSTFMRLFEEREGQYEDASKAFDGSIEPGYIG